jgi:hypothetical protein
MAYHDWSEKEFDWVALNDCQLIMYKYARTIGRVGGDIKEKYGSLRFYVHFSEFSMQSLFYPGYCYIQFPRWFHFGLEYKFLKYIYKYTGLNCLFLKWQLFWYSYAYNKACKTYPHIVDEILCCADHPELIKNYHKFYHPILINNVHNLFDKNLKLEKELEELKKPNETI